MSDQNFTTEVTPPSNQPAAGTSINIGVVPQIIFGLTLLAAVSIPSVLLMQKSKQDQAIIAALLARDVAPQAQVAPASPVVVEALKSEPAVEVIDIPSEEAISEDDQSLNTSVDEVPEGFDPSIDFSVLSDEILEIPLTPAPSLEDVLSPRAQELVAELRAQAGTDPLDLDLPVYAEQAIGYVPQTEPPLVSSGSFSIGDAAYLDISWPYDLDELGDIISNEDPHLTPTMLIPKDELVDTSFSGDAIIAVGNHFLSSNSVIHDGEIFHLHGTYNVTHDDVCTTGQGTPFDCVDWALTAMSSGISEGELTCESVGLDLRHDGSIPAVCHLLVGDAEPIDLASWSVLAGINRANPENSALMTLEDEAQLERRGIWSGDIQIAVFRPHQRPNMSSDLRPILHQSLLPKLRLNLRPKSRPITLSQK